MRKELLLAALAIVLMTPVDGWAQASSAGQSTAGGSNASGADGSNIPTTGGSDLSEDAIGGRGAAMEGSGVEGSQGAPGGAAEGNPDCPPGKSVEARCRN